MISRGDQKTMTLCSCGYSAHGDVRTAKFNMILHKKKCNGKGVKFDLQSGQHISEFKDGTKNVIVNNYIYKCLNKNQRAKQVNQIKNIEKVLGGDKREEWN